MNETQEIENYLLGEHTAHHLVMEARLLLDEDLREKTAWQKKTYALVQEYGRKKLKAEIEHIHQQLFTAPEHISFRQRIFSFFSK